MCFFSFPFIFAHWNFTKQTLSVESINWKRSLIEPTYQYSTYKVLYLVQWLNSSTDINCRDTWAVHLQRNNKNMGHYLKYHTPIFKWSESFILLIFSPKNRCNTFSCHVFSAYHCWFLLNAIIHAVGLNGKTLMTIYGITIQNVQAVLSCGHFCQQIVLKSTKRCFNTYDYIHDVNFVSKYNFKCQLASRKLCFLFDWVF